ncbi:hypothetical protein P4S68_21240 [Pseudoalteromonas sp. Hal099]
MNKKLKHNQQLRGILRDRNISGAGRLSGERKYPEQAQTPKMPAQATPNSEAKPHNTSPQASESQNDSPPWHDHAQGDSAKKPTLLVTGSQTPVGASNAKPASA